MDIIDKNIRDNIIENINQGKYKTDGKLPSDNELALKYGVPRIKIRKIYERLEDMGYIYSLQGRGRFFKGKSEHIELVLSGNESFSKKLKSKGYDLVTKNIFCERIPFNRKIYNELKVERNIAVYRIGRLRFVGGEPIAIHISYLADSVFPNIYEEGKKITSVFEYYESKGFSNYISGKNLLSLGYPIFKEGEYLQCGELVPLLKLETNCIDEKKNIVLEYTEILYRGDKFKYEINLNK